MRTSLLAATMLLALAGAGHAQTVIGTAGPTSNAEALFGTTWMNGMELAVRQANAAGGVGGQQLRVAREDDGGDPRQGVLVAQKQCDDKAIVAVIANFNSGVTIPTSDVYHRCEMPQVTNSSNPRVTKAGYKTLFRPIANDLAQGAAPAEYAIGTLKAKSAAVVHDKQAFGQGVAEVFRDSFTKGGGTVASFSGVAATDVDFSALLTSMRRANPDVIYFGGTMPAVGLFVKQARELGLKATIFAADSAFTPDFIAGAGAASEGAVVSFQAPPYDSSPELKAFAASYKSAFNEEPGPYSAYGFMEANVVIAGLKAAGASPTRAAVGAALAKTNLDTLIGHVAFTPDGELQQALVFLYQVKGGKFDLLTKP